MVAGNQGWSDFGLMKAFRNSHIVNPYKFYDGVM